jgi:hypothetical protein
MMAIVCHDAGGAEILSSYVRRNRPQCAFVLAGPARTIFERKLGSVESVELQIALEAASEVLCGTSWQSDLEFNAIRTARTLNKRSVAFIDHWVNYRDRFLRNGEYCVPDEIWTGDKHALDLAQREFSGTMVRYVESPYLLDIKEALTQCKRSLSADTAGRRVLYVGEPIAEHAELRFGDRLHWGYTEEQALAYFLDNASLLGEIAEIVLRPHPAEALGKYAHIAELSHLPITIRGDRALAQEVVDCDVVVGCNSMAMVVGVLGGRRVICAIPPGGRGFALPHDEIESLQQIVQRLRADVAR